MELIHDCNALERVLAPLRRRRRVGLVPTMGALHAGHLSLLEHGRAGGAELLVASIFVNPTQFGPHEDFSRYPRTLAADLEALEAAGCDLAFVPTVEAIYPPGFDDFVEPDADPGAPSHGFEGEVRKGHFRGVATVVNRLFALVRPQLAVFGEKDAQQLAVIRWLVATRALPIKILMAPVVRESDGVAMSSRNRYLDPAARRAAAVIPRALAQAADLAERGEHDTPRLVEAVRHELATEPLIDSIDYVAVVDEHNFVPLEHLGPTARLVLAARIGATRLLDTQRFPRES